VRAAWGFVGGGGGLALDLARLRVCTGQGFHLGLVHHAEPAQAQDGAALRLGDRLHHGVAEVVALEPFHVGDPDLLGRPPVGSLSPHGDDADAALRDLAQDRRADLVDVGELIRRALLGVEDRLALEREVLERLRGGVEPCAFAAGAVVRDALTRVESPDVARGDEDIKGFGGQVAARRREFFRHGLAFRGDATEQNVQDANTKENAHGFFTFLSERTVSVFAGRAWRSCTTLLYVYPEPPGSSPTSAS